MGYTEIGYFILAGLAGLSLLTIMVFSIISHINFNRKLNPNKQHKENETPKIEDDKIEEFNGEVSEHANQDNDNIIIIKRYTQ